MNLHKEIALENDICLHLASHGWLCADGDGGLYDRKYALLPAMKGASDPVFISARKAYDGLSRSRRASSPDRRPDVTVSERVVCRPLRIGAG